MNCVTYQQVIINPWATRRWVLDSALFDKLHYLCKITHLLYDDFEFCVLQTVLFHGLVEAYDQ